MEARHGLVEVAEHLQGRPEVVIGQGEVGLVAHGGPVRGNGVFVAALSLQDVAEVKVGLGVGGLLLHRPAKPRLGLGELPLPL